MKRLLGLAGVKLRSAGGLSLGEDTLVINSLYPFLPVDKAYEMIVEMLPSYTISQDMIQLPEKSFLGAYFITKLVLAHSNWCFILFQTYHFEYGASLVIHIDGPFVIHFNRK